MIAKNPFLLIGSVMILFSSCTVKNYPLTARVPLPVSDSVKLLTAHTWRETSVVVHKFINGDTIQYDITKQFATVDGDDYTLFYPDGTFLFEEGKSKYALGSTQKYQKGTWRMAEKESALTLTFNQTTDRYTVLNLNPFKMVLSLAVQREDIHYKYIITYTPEIENNSFSASPEDKIYTEVETPPQYPGGTKAFTRMLQRTQKYPLQARKKGIEGKVLIAFVIHEDGKPGNFEVVQSLGSGCDEATIRSLQTMPAWNPGRHRGEAVKVKMLVPVAFRLN